MYSAIQSYCDSLTHEFDSIPNERKAVLEKISGYISQKLVRNQSVNLVYICTHNSRRSHFGQIWAVIASNYYRISNINTYSGGTEATAFHPNAINALKRIGFSVSVIKADQNPVCLVVFDDQHKPIECFSKVYDDAVNPKTDFAAIMTCSDAEENCPFIPDVDLRVGTTYDDPKAFDNTPQQDAKYDERCRQIARETLYAFSKVTR